MRNVPYGQTITYKQLSNSLQKADSSMQSNKARAVGNALGHNPLMIIIPCHRVVGVNGSLRGYAGGLERKQILLNLEQKD
ncbi:methylated-DNA--[protein]-cysteine S-methyltransferase [Liquorilactobacillus hordei]|uniref:methylated-DNA--[protein]-cysteine S-methyltransferase n=1 Tax=Liquorilactobacillus hordei TaxID=468911 RepID=UPI0039EA2C86